MTKLTIEMIDEFLSGKMSNGAMEIFAIECVHFARRVLEAQAKGGKMVPSVPTYEMIVELSICCGGSGDQMKENWLRMLKVAPDMLGDLK